MSLLNLHSSWELVIFAFEMDLGVFWMEVVR